MYECKILLDSDSSDSMRHNHRLTTFQITFPRIVLAEFNTHRVLSRNSASSRAIPVHKRIASVRADPFIPEAFGANKAGMQAGDTNPQVQASCREAWLEAIEAALQQAEKLADLGVHKQWANRLLEPFSWHTVIVTATEWDNFFALRCNKDAQPEIRTIAQMMLESLRASTPHHREWHLPMVDLEADDELLRDSSLMMPPLGEFDVTPFVQLSVARCARVSYLTHEGERDVMADIGLYNRLWGSGHMSPFEHAARAMSFVEYRLNPWCGNFRGWVQHRKEIAGEAIFGGNVGDL